MASESIDNRYVRLLSQNLWVLTLKTMHNQLETQAEEDQRSERSNFQGRPCSDAP